MAVFAKEVVNRSQGTVSSLLGNPPSSFPRGTGNEPSHKMRTFLTNNALQEQLLAAAAKGVMICFSRDLCTILIG